MGIHPENYHYSFEKEIILIFFFPFRISGTYGITPELSDKNLFDVLNSLSPWKKTLKSQMLS